MKYIALVVLLFFVLPNSIAQNDNFQINFRKGSQTFEANLTKFTSIAQLNPNEIFDNHFYRIIQFNEIPTELQHQQIANAGIKLIDYIPNKAYISSIPLSVDFSIFQDLDVRGVFPINTINKTSTRIDDYDFPDWALDGQLVTLSLKYYEDISVDNIVANLVDLQVRVTEKLTHGQILIIQIPIRQIEKLIQLPFINFLDVISEPGKPESDDGRHLHQSNAIDGDYYGARDYDGTGVSIAINDDGAVGPHIDFQGRLNQQNVGGPNNSGGTHGDMTTGIAGGAGNLDPEIRGMATGSYIHVRDYVANMSGTVPLHQDSAVLVFSSSYSNGCNAGYTNTTALVDEEIFNNPTLMQVFSAGNSNNNDCGYGAGSQWGNVTGGHKIGKNVIATANLDNDDQIANTSSRGPASDGRIKPDISAHGRDQMSTDPNNTYSPGGGTSAAAPGIAGVMAQLHHAYSSLNGGATAPSALLKATLLNSAEELGNDGPDFIFGWGKVNGLGAVKILENNQYLTSSISQGGTNSHQIAIPAGVQRAKIMIYWADKEASTTAATALVNDLDATVVSPGNTTYFPWILDHTPNPVNLAATATTGVDHLNNIEQIAIDLPTGGIYTLNVDGTTIPFGTQEYYVVYEFLTDEITVIHPMGGEGLIPNTNSRIHWSAYANSGTFLIEYTENNGNTWNTLSANEPGSNRIYEWQVPNTITGQARVRVTRSGISDESDANFTIIERPQNIQIERICIDSGYIRMEWDAVPGATSYDVFQLGQKYMDSIGNSPGLHFNVPVANINDSVWLSVRAVGPNGIRGLRQIAFYYQGSLNGQDCYIGCGSVGHDAGLSEILSPSLIVENCDGQSSQVDVSVLLENIGLFQESNFDIYYQIDNDPIVSETFTGTLNNGGFSNFTFSSQIMVNSPGSHTLKVWTGLLNDDAYCNDTLTQNLVINFPLAQFPISEDFEGITFPPATGTIENPDGDITWEEETVNGANGILTEAIFIENFTYDATGQEDIFKLVPIDLSVIAPNTDAFLTFDVAYARYSNTYYDGLRIDISTDCGLTFNQVYYKENQDLATTFDDFSFFAPIDDQDWRKDTVDLAPYVGSSVIIRFVSVTGYGNNLYLDNINVDGFFFVGFDEPRSSNDFILVPNPANQFTTIQFKESLDQNQRVELINQNGQIIIDTEIKTGQSQKTIDLKMISPSIYFIRATNSNGVNIRKLVVD